MVMDMVHGYLVIVLRYNCDINTLVFDFILIILFVYMAICITATENSILEICIIVPGYN